MNADFYKLVRTLESLTEETPESKKLENGKSVLKESTITEMDKSQPSGDRGGESSGDPYAKGGKAVPVTSRNMDKKALQTLNRSMNKAYKKDVKEQQQGVGEGSLEEVAPPGAKAERMVKHIKAGYATDGDLTDKEKGIAYATAWKAHNKGKVEESQIDEGTDGSYYIVGIGRTAIKPVEVKTLSQAIADAKAMIARGQNVQVKQGSPIGATVALDMDTSSIPSREKDAARIEAYRQSRQAMKDKAMDAYLKKEMDLAKERDKLSSRQLAQTEIDQLYSPLRVKPTAALAKPMEPQSTEKAPARTWREVDKDLMGQRTDKEYRRARAALRNPFGGLGVAESKGKVNEAEVWRPGMPPPPNPDMGSSLTPGEQKRVTVPQGPDGTGQATLPQPKKPAPVPKKTSELGTDTDVAESEKSKNKKSDRLPIYQESIRFKTINKLIREEFDLENDNISLEEKDIKSALGDELFNELQAVKNGESEMSEQLKDALFKYYQNTGDLPPEVSRDEQDVTNYIKDRIMSMSSDSESEQSADRLPVSEDQKVKGTRYGGSAQVDDEETDDDTDTKKAATTEPKRGRGRPRKDSGDANTKAKYSGASELQSMIVGNVPKKSKDLGKLPTTKHKLKGE